MHPGHLQEENVTEHEPDTLRSHSPRLQQLNNVRHALIVVLEQIAVDRRWILFASVDGDDVRVCLLLQARVNVQLKVILVDPVVQQVDVGGEENGIASVQADQPNRRFRRAKHRADLLLLPTRVVLVLRPEEKSHGAAVFHSMLRFLLQGSVQSMQCDFRGTCSYHEIPVGVHVDHTVVKVMQSTTGQCESNHLNRGLVPFAD